MKNHFISFEEMTIEEAEKFVDLGFCVVVDGDSKTVIISLD